MRLRDHPDGHAAEEGDDEVNAGRTSDAEPRYQLWMDGRPLNLPTDYIPLRDARFIAGVTGRRVAVIELRSGRVIDPARHSGRRTS